MATSYEKYVWTQIIPGVWQRSCDEIERYYAVVAKLHEGSGRMFFAMTGHIRVVFDQLDPSAVASEARAEKALRMAWLTLRHDHPTVASQVIWSPSRGGFVKVYREIPGLVDQQAWLTKTFVKATTGQTGAEWANSDPPAPKFPTLFVMDPPAPSDEDHDKLVRRDLVFRAPHDIIDGIGTLLLMNNLVRLASKAYELGDAYELPTFDGSEAANLSPPFRVAADIPFNPTEKVKSRLAELEAGRQLMKSPQAEANITTLAVPWKRGAVVPGRHQRVALSLSELQTSMLVDACAAIGATVTHAFHAAIPMVIRDIQEKISTEQGVRYVGYILRNERRNCLEPYSTAKHPAALYHSSSGVKLTVDMTLPAAGSDDCTESQTRADFLEILQRTKLFYHGVRDDTEHAQLAPYYWAAGTPPLPTFSNELLPVPPPAAMPSVSISSMGRIDDIIPAQFGVLRVYEPWVTGEELRNGLGLFLGTHRGELCLSAAYNDAWHDEHEVAEFLQRCKEIVFKGLEL